MISFEIANKEENNFLNNIFFLKQMENLIFIFFDGNLNYNEYQSIKFVIKSNYFRGDIKMRGIKIRFLVIISYRFVFRLIKYEERIKT